MRIQNTSPLFHREGVLNQIVKLYTATSPRYYSMFTTGRNTNNFYDKIATESDFSAAAGVNEGDAFDFVDFATPQYMDVYPRIRGLANAISKLALQSDPYGVMARRMKKMMESVRKSMEYDAADFMNLATTAYTAGSSAAQVPDGLALASAVHPLQTGTASNIITGNPALSVSSLELAKQLFFRQVSFVGDPMVYDKALLLLVPPELVGLATRLTETEKYPTTNDNDINWGGRNVKVVENPYFTSTTAWALVAADPSDNPLTMLTRRGIVADTDEDKIRDAVVGIVSGVWVKYAADWRNFLYSAGA